MHLYNITTATAPTPITLPNPTSVSALGISIDAGNDVAFLTQDVPATTATYNACLPPNFSCAVVGPASAIPGGQWLALDGLGNAFATQLSGTNSGVIQFDAAAGPATKTQVYTSATAPGAYYGLVATPGGEVIYVAEGPANAVNGAGITIHACATPCAAGGTDITASLRTSMGSPTANFSGAMGLDGLGDLVLGLSNTAGANNTASTITVAVVCAMPSSTFQCQYTSFLSGTFTSVNGFNPWDGTAGIALDPSFNIYTAAFLHGGGSTAPLPSIYAFADNDTFQPFSCSTTTGSPAVPNCAINQLPGPPVYMPGTQPAPYSIAATTFNSR